MINLRDQMPRLLSMDFDGTISRTSETGPSIHSVDDAYHEAVREVLGEGAAEAYIEGDAPHHQDRTPGEIVRSLDPNLGPDEHKVATMQVVGVKLEILTAQIGKLLPDETRWPRLVDGFEDTWAIVNNARDEGMPIGTAIVSAGHTRFQQRVFDQWNIPYPDMFLTDDVVSAMAINMPAGKLAKPSSFLINLARNLYLQKLDLERNPGLQYLRGSVLDCVHVGDSPKKDRGAAIRAGAMPVLIDSENPRQGWESVPAYLGIDVGETAITGALVND